MAHKFYANLEADIGQSQRALVRLLGEATRHGNDPELFAGLVHACRYCGLYEESIAAHAEARRLDPNVPTSVEQTLLMTGDIDRLLAVDPAPIAGGADHGIRVIALGLAGRRDEARRALLHMRQTSRIPALQTWTEHLMAWLDRRPADMIVGIAVSQRSEDSGRPGGDLPGGMAALRRRRARKGTRLSFGAPSPRATPWPRLFPAAGNSTRCEAIPLFRRFSRKRKRAAGMRWPRSARPAANDSSARERRRPECDARDRSCGCEAA